MAITLTDAIVRSMPEGESFEAGPWREMILNTLPWAVALTPDDLTLMAEQLAAAAHHWAETGDSREIAEVEEDWRATVDLLHDEEALSHLARPTRKYIRW